MYPPTVDGTPLSSDQITATETYSDDICTALGISNIALETYASSTDQGSTNSNWRMLLKALLIWLTELGGA
jgi:hypothetical protein